MAAIAFDRAAINKAGRDARTNFPLDNYANEIEDLQGSCLLVPAKDWASPRLPRDGVHHLDKSLPVPRSNPSKVALGIVLLLEKPCQCMTSSMQCSHGFDESHCNAEDKGSQECHTDKPLPRGFSAEADPAMACPDQCWRPAGADP